jgi:hypothetical protein
MIFKHINRRCGHKEQIGIAGYSGEIENIANLVDKQKCWDSVKNAERKLCLPCFTKLSREDKRKEVWLHE